jgi:hypothetical protein
VFPNNILTACVNNLERIIRRCTHKRKHGLTGTDDVVQEPGTTHHDIVAVQQPHTPPVRAMSRRRSSFMDLAAHGDVNSDEEDNEREVKGVIYSLYTYIHV